MVWTQNYHLSTSDIQLHSTSSSAISASFKTNSDLLQGYRSIPQTMPPKRAKNPVNQPIVTLLNDETESIRSDNLKQTYRRAIRQITLVDFPITSKQDALRVRCVGEYIATKIDIFLRTARESNARAAAAALARQQASMRHDRRASTTHAPIDPQACPPQRTQHAAQLGQDQTLSNAMVKTGSSDGVTTEVRSGKKGRSLGTVRRGRQASSSRQGGPRKPYTPKFRSGNFAFLLVLLDALDEGVNELSRGQVQSRAKKYCDEPIVRAKTADPATFYDAWSGMSTLTKKGLVAKHGSPARYLLTVTGIECARICRQMGVDAASRTASMSNPKARRPIRDGEDDHERAGKAPLSRRRGAGAVTEPRKKRVGASQSAGKGATSAGASDVHYGFGSEDFGCLRDKTAKSVEKVTRGSSGAPHDPSEGAIFDVKVHRAVIASERCEADGYAREDCLDVLREIFDNGELPCSIDVLHGRMRDLLCERQRAGSGDAERRQATLQESTQVRSSVLASGRRPEPMQPNFTASLPFAQADVSQVEENAPTEFGPGANPETLRLTERTNLGSESNTARTLSGPGRGNWGQSNSDLSHYLDLEEPRPGNLVKAADEVISSLPRNAISGGVRSSGSQHSDPVIHEDDSVIDLCEETSDRSPGAPSRKRPRAAISGGPGASRGRKKESRKMLHHAVDLVNIGDGDFNTRGESSYASQGKAASSKCNDAEQIAPMDDRPGEIAQLPRPTQATLISGGCQTDCSVILILDSMERTQRSTLSLGDTNTMANMLVENGVKCEVRHLPCGDAMFIAQFADGTEVVLDYLIERKTVDDFAASMNDGRVAKQSYMMSQSRIERRMFVLEGDINGNVEMRGKPEYLQKLARLEVCDDFYVKRTKNLNETIWFYSSMYTRLCKNFQGYPKHALLEGRALFSDWNTRMKRLKNGITLEQLFALQLCQIRGISTVTALAILRKGYNTPQALYRAFKNEPDLERRETLLADSEEGISKRTSRLLCKLFTATDYGTEILEET